MGTPNSCITDPLADIGAVVAALKQQDAQSAESATQVLEDRQAFFDQFHEICRTGIRPAMQAVLDRLQSDGGDLESFRRHRRSLRRGTGRDRAPLGSNLKLVRDDGRGRAWLIFDAGGELFKYQCYRMDGEPPSSAARPPRAAVNVLAGAA